MVKPNGDELYLEIEHKGEISDWVKKNVLPYFTGPAIPREEAKSIIKDFVGPDSPYLVSYVNQFDIIYWYKLFTIEGQPAYWIPIDFASILFGYGLNPSGLSDRKFLADIEIDISQYRKHHALDDAKLLKEAYIKFFEKYGRQSGN